VAGEPFLLGIEGRSVKVTGSGVVGKEGLLVRCGVPAECGQSMGLNLSASNFFVHLLLELGLDELVFGETAFIEVLNVIFGHLLVYGGTGVDILAAGFVGGGSRTCGDKISNADVNLHTM
jgi:hypothetical protein